jgi:hypothetical protein
MKRPAKVSIRLTRCAAEKSHKIEDLKKAALGAFDAAGGGDIYFLPFSANGQQFALSARTIIEVEWLPNKVPQRLIRQALAGFARPKRPAR